MLKTNILKLSAIRRHRMTLKSLLGIHIFILTILLTHSVSAQNQFNINRVGNALFSPIVLDLEIRGDYVYCTDSYGLSVWDISDPENLSKISSCRIPSGPSRLCINGDYAYLSIVGCGIVVVNISDPENPEVVNQLELDIIRSLLSHPYPHISIRGGMLFISGGWAGFYIASLEDPTEPEITAHYRFGGNHNFHTEILGSDNATYLLSNDLYVLNIDDPANVEIIDTINVDGGLDMDIDDNRLGIANGGEICFFSLDNPHAPELVSVIERNSARAIDIHGDYVYSGRRGGIRIDNISNIAEPEFVSNLGGRLGGESISYRDDIVFGASSGYGIMAVSVVDPENPEMFNTPLPWHVVEDFVVKDSLAFVLDSGELHMLYIMDISDPTDPVTIGEIDGVGGRYQTIDILNDYAYHINRNGIKIINISDPTAPELVAEYEEPQQYLFNKTKIIDGCIYITGSYRVDGRSKHLVVWDLSDPCNPELTFSAEDFEDGNGYGSSWHAGNYFYQKNGGDDEILIYSLADPAEPELVAHWVGGSGRQLFVSNSILYVSGENRLDMYSAENLEPDYLGFTEFPFVLQSVAVEGEIAYLSCHGVGMVCMSMESPLNPEIVGHYDTSGDIRKLNPHNGHVFVADVIEFGVYQLDYEIGDNADFMISMHEGWNLISSPFAPENRDIESLFSRLAVNHNLIIVKDHNGRFNLPEHDFNNIPFWDVNYGYQVKLNDADNLWITGEEVEVDRAIPLQEGWSMVSYFPVEDVETETAFTNIAEQILMAKDGDGQFYAPQFNFNSIPPLHRGAGYQVKVSEEVELVWNVEEGVVARSEATKQTQRLLHFVRKDGTGSNMSVLVNECESGEIGAFSIDGTCVGAGTVDPDGRCDLAVWGDDESTEDVDGLKYGEAFTLKFWNSSRGVEFDLEPEMIVAGSGLIYETDGFTFFAAKALPSIPDQYYLSQNYPNPFNSTTILPYGLPEKAFMSISIYDISGRMVETLINGEVEAGYHTVTWEASTVSTGVYLVRMDCGVFSSIRKVILVK